MQAWNFEADQIHVTDSPKQEEIVINESIKEYLNTKSVLNKLFLIAPKGLGKTLILKTKSVSYRQLHEGIRCIPAEELCEKISLANNSISREEFYQFEKLDQWLRIWRICLCIAILRRCELDIPSAILNRLGKAREVSDILNVIIQDKHFFIYKEGWRLLDSDVMPEIRHNKMPVTFFLDSLDQAISQLIRNQEFDFESEKEVESAINMWANSQLGLLHAAHQLCVQNSFIKIFATIREEAFELDESDVQMQLKDYSVFIKYTRAELREIFASNIDKTPSSKLSQPKEDDPFMRFLGLTKITHSFVKAIDEDVFDFMYRHTFGRPRELVLMGRKIFEMNPNERTEESLRKKVNKVSHDDIFGQFKKEIIPSFNDKALVEFCRCLSRNVFTAADTKQLNQKDLGFYYKLGLIGRSKKIVHSGRYMQEFSVANKFNYKTSLVFPEADYYFTHPAMDGLLIDTLKKGYNKQNIIGYGLNFEIPPKGYSGISLKAMEKVSEIRKTDKKREVHVLISSPSDVGVREIILSTLETQFRTKKYEEYCQCRIIPRGWEELASQAGDAQTVITEKILNEIDMIVVILKHKLGTPTIDPTTRKVKFESGTVEELFYGLDSHERRKKIVTSVYFSNHAPIVNGNDPNGAKILREWKRVGKFKRKIQTKVLYKEWENEDELISKIIDDLRDNIRDRLK